MDYLEVVNNALVDFYKSKIIVKDIEINIEKIAKKNFINKFSKRTLKIDGQYYEFHGSRVLCWFVDACLFDNKKIHVNLYFIRRSNLKATEKYRIKQELDRFERVGIMWETNHKIPLILEFTCELSLDKIVNNSFNLDIEKQMI